jgi:hypothetical protein
MRPEFSNSKVRMLGNITMDCHVEAAAWLNITDEELRQKLIDYIERERKNINVHLSRRTGEGYDKVKVATFNLFLNKPRDEQPQSTEEKTYGGFPE